MVGFERKYDSGTDPLPCWKTGRWNSRAYVNFNVWAAKPQIESLAIATLSWQPSTKRFQAGIASNEPANLAPHCFKALHEGSLPWVSNGKRLLGDLITDDLTVLESGKPITITPTVKKWVALGSGVLPSGLTFTARDENLSGDQNKYCWTTLNSLKLDVTYKAP